MFGKAKRRAFVFAFILLIVLSSPGGTIKVANLPTTGTNAAVGISTTNTYLCSIDFGNNATPPGNINSVPFIHPDRGNQIVNPAASSQRFYRVLVASALIFI